MRETMEEGFFQSEYSLEDLEQFRDENGFIDLSKAKIQFTAETREETGNTDRVKNWVNFNGTKTLIKGEAILAQERNYGIYSEIIVEEIAKQLGVETAHYDLVKFYDENGQVSFGVLSEMMMNLENEQLVMLHEMIGDEPEEDGDFLDTTSYEFTVQKLSEVLVKDGYSEENIERVLTDYKKRLVFTLSILDVDKHIENVAFIKKKVNGKNTIRMSPNYDSESALMLDNDISTISKLLEDYASLKESASQAHPRIGTLRSIEEGGFNSYWMDTLEALCEDDEIYDYYTDCIRGKIDMEVIFERVEARIKAPLPEDVKLIAKHSYNIRNMQMEQIMDGEMQVEEQVDISTFMMSLIQKGVQQQIRTGEQLPIGKIMQADMARESSQISKDDLEIGEK